MKLFRVFLLMFVAATILLVSSNANADERLRDLKKLVKDVLENASSSPAEKIEVIRRFGNVGEREAKKAAEELLGMLTNKKIFSDAVTARLQAEYEAAAAKFAEMDAQVRDGNMLRFGGGNPSQEEYTAQQQKVAESRQRLNGGNKVRDAIIDVLGQMKDADAREEILDTVRNSKSPAEQVTACIEAMQRFRWPNVFEEMEKIYNSNSDPDVRGICIVSMRMMDADRAMPTLFKALNDDNCWIGRSHAISALRRVRSREAVDALVQRLGKEAPGRLKWDIIEALQDVSGKDFGEQDAAWRSWWSQNKEGFQSRPVGSPAPADARGAAVTGTSFYGIPVRGNPMFIIDRSGSMLESSKARGQNQPGQAPAPVPAGEKSKWQVLQEELFKAVKGLPPTAKFAIVWFDSEVAAHKNGKILTATDAEKSEAETTISAMSANGMTNIYGAFELGFSLLKPGLGGAAGGGAVVTGEREPARLGCDEIFFLTDGSPTIGEAINGISPTNGGNNREYSKLLLEKICEWNKPYNMVINTICVGMGDDSFLSQLASRNRGKFVKVD